MKIIGDSAKTEPRPQASAEEVIQLGRETVSRPPREFDDHFAVERAPLEQF